MNCSLFIIYDVQVAPQVSWHCSCPFLGVFLEFKWLFKAGHVTCSNFQAIWGISQWPRLITTVLLYTTVQKNAGAFIFLLFFCGLHHVQGIFPNQGKPWSCVIFTRKAYTGGLRLVPHFPLQELLPHSAAATLAWETPGMHCCSSNSHIHCAPQAILKNSIHHRVHSNRTFSISSLSFLPFSLFSYRAKEKPFHNAVEGSCDGTGER